MKEKGFNNNLLLVPSGGSGVQRWVKFAKYLRDYGWEPVIFTPQNPERPYQDKSLLHDIPNDIEIIKTPIWEPYSFYKKFVGLKKDEKLGSGLMTSGNESGILQKISIWIRGNLFIPDARKFWVKPSIKYISKCIDTKQFQAIVSTGPPHSMHLIALGISQLTSIPWLADFRDPWTNIDFFEDLKPSNYARAKHHKLEKKTLDKASRVVVISPTMKSEFEQITDTPISVITNGFDTTDFENISIERNDKFTLSHVGMMTATRNPDILWSSLKELCKEHTEFKSSFELQIVGKTDITIRKSINSFGVQDIVSIKDYVPHSKIISYQKNSDALLLIVNNTPNANLILSGKFFEYLAANRPILCISPLEGDMGKILNETKAGTLFTYDQKNQLKEHLMFLFNNWRTGKTKHAPKNIEVYSRKSLTKKLAQELNALTQ